MPAANDPTVPMTVVAPEETERYGRQRRPRFSAGGVALPALLVAASIVTVLVVVAVAALSPKQAAGIVPSGGVSGSGASGPVTTPQASSPGSGRSAKPGGPGGTAPRPSAAATTAAGSPRTNRAPASSPPTTSTGHYPAWQANHPYAAGDRVSYAGRDYQCLLAHTSQVGWEPPNTPAVWQVLT